MRASRLSAIFCLLLASSAIAADSDSKSKAFVPPADAQWTIVCQVFTDSNHQAEATQAKELWIQQTGLPGFYVIHKQDQSTLYYGYYRSIDDAHDRKESDRAQADRHHLEELTDSNGTHPFVGSVFVELVPKDPPAPPEWNLVNAKGYWSLQVAVYEDDPRRKQAAVDSVKDMRAHGIEAYYYHGDTASSVCIGTWPKEAVKQQTEQYNNPDQPVLVSNSQLGEGDPYLRATGQKLQQMTPKVVITDSSLQAMMTRYPYEAINGDMEIRDSTGKLIKGATPSYVVEVPHDQAQASASDANDSSNQQLPPAFVPPPPPQTDSTAGGLRSIDSK